MLWVQGCFWMWGVTLLTTTGCLMGRPVGSVTIRWLTSAFFLSNRKAIQTGTSYGFISSIGGTVLGNYWLKKKTYRLHPPKAAQTLPGCSRSDGLFHQWAICSRISVRTNMGLTPPDTLSHCVRKYLWQAINHAVAESLFILERLQVLKFFLEYLCRCRGTLDASNLHEVA